MLDWRNEVFVACEATGNFRHVSQIDVTDALRVVNSSPGINVCSYEGI
jgi:hypothetical protein